MNGDSPPDGTALVDEVAGALQASVRLLVQRLRQSPAVGDDLTSSETSALARLSMNGPSSPSDLAKLERISPQSMGATVAALERRDLVRRAADPNDGRRTILSLTVAGEALHQSRRSARNESLVQALGSDFTRIELKQLLVATHLIERLAENL